MPRQSLQSKGGNACLEKYGPDFYRKIGKKGGRSFVKKHGSIKKLTEKRKKD